MARETYELSDETRKVLSHNPQAIADEMGKHQSHIYDYLELRATDIFAKFLPLYGAAIRAGAPTCYWENRLAAIRARYQQKYPDKTSIECLKDKLEAHNKTLNKLYESLSDGELDEREIADLQELVEKEIEELMTLNTQLTFQMGVISASKK